VTSSPPVSPDSSTDEPTGFTLWAVWRRGPAVRGAVDTSGLADAVAAVEASGVAVRGLYDVSGLRADADLMVWLTGDAVEALQAALRILRRVPAIAALLPTWNVLGTHRPAEFARGHVPAFLRGLPPKSWLTVYPFVRSYDWYLLPDEQRSAMLSDHGRKGAQHPVQANTVANFALGDYEWVLALEADDVVDTVDLMRHLRKTEARLHIREEVPFFTGRRIGIDEVTEVLG
jgi:chlorite dismutase